MRKYLLSIMVLLSALAEKDRLNLLSEVIQKPGLRKGVVVYLSPDPAAETLIDFEKLMVQVINNARDKVKGRIVFTSPFIRIGKKRLECNIENICEKTGYREVIPGIGEFRNNQVVGRKIFVLEKK